MKRYTYLWLIAAGGAVMILAFIGWLAWDHIETRRAMDLLSAAYAEKRTLELRIENARYKRLQESDADSVSARTRRPLPLLKAESILARVIRDHPDLESALQARARADLLDWNYETAIVTLDHLNRTHPDVIAYRIDLASAFFERGVQERRASDFGTCLYLLSHIGRSQADPVVLFNTAIAAERLHLYHEAADNWHRLLEIEHDNGWIQEARHHLILDERLCARENPVRWDSDADSRSALNGLAPDVEAAVQSGIVQLAPQHFMPGAGEARRRSADAKLVGLSRMLLRDHHDSWLTDFMGGTRSTTAVAAAQALADAIQANHNELYKEAEAKSERAIQGFETTGNVAGVLRARAEKIYALHRAGRGGDCLLVSLSTAARLKGHNYRWLEAQVGIEESICETMSEQFQKAEKTIEASLTVAHAASYPTLYLRALGILASYETATGNYPAAWQLDEDGLEAYWSGDYPPERAFQFYADLTDVAESQQQWELALMLSREAAQAITATSYRAFEAMAWHRVGRLAALLGAEAEARQSYKHARSLFSSLPMDSVRRTYELEGKIGEAVLSGQSADESRSLSRLESLRADVERVADFTVALEFYKALATLQLRSGNTAGAETALRAELSIAERGSRSLDVGSQRVYWSRAEAQPFRELVGIKLNAGATMDAIELWEHFRATAVSAQEGHAGPYDLSGNTKTAVIRHDSVRKCLPTLTDRTIVSYIGTPSGIEICLFDNRGVRHVCPAIEPQHLKQMVRRFIDDCSNSHSTLEALRQEGRSLYRWLIKPIEPFLEAGRTLSVETDDFLMSLPMQALVDDSGSYFGERFSIVISPGILCRRIPFGREEITKENRTLVVAAPAFGRLAHRFPPLPDALSEGWAVEKHFDNAVLLSGHTATLENVERELATAEIFHFAGHSIASSTGGGLLLAKQLNGVIDATLDAEIFNASNLGHKQVSHCRLVVLSACSTAMAEDNGPANPASIVDAFLRAGVLTVVASAWDVDSTSTALLMQSFYTSLLEGSSVQDGLRYAAAGLRKHPETAHPHYWAAFSAYSVN